MNLKNKIDHLMLLQGENIVKPRDSVLKSYSSLDKLNIDKESDFYNFFSTYFTYGLIKRVGIESLVEVAREKEFLALNRNLKNSWNIPNEYIIFANDGYSGGYLYNTEDNSVWNFTLGEQDLLGTDKMKHWDSFYAFLEWYLTSEEE
ncbi:hypothetical protein [Otariodibacter oris]|uniref:SMI1/KNR4 family protein SUKH-1 n=1 Tax=Otariodibacter oris TaxID=1032623 RepID=A0A420XI62_9PAST|nr:hypothetical protein [Otariodibacter oris]QGM81037.1 hypothetical protein A6A10_06270 [Otariodibacter oris]RKR76780.1 hypothetical protein DES31_0087 [Otariodibacter oris]